MTDEEKKNREKALQAAVKLCDELQDRRCLVTDEAWTAMLDCFAAFAVFLPAEND